jgi:hypothetical protein
VISPSSASILDQSRIGGHPENTYMQVPLSIEKPLLLLKPPLLVQRCNGTTAGLGSLEVLEFSMQILLLGQLAIVSALSTSNGGEGYNSSPDLNPITITSIQLRCTQAASPHLNDKTTSNPLATKYLGIFRV